MPLFQIKSRAKPSMRYENEFAICKMCWRYTCFEAETKSNSGMTQYKWELTFAFLTLRSCLVVRDQLLIFCPKNLQ